METEENTLDVRERELRHMAAELRMYHAALVSAQERFKALHRLAVNPMKSWDAGAVIDAQRVEDEANEGLDAIGLTIARGPLPPDSLSDALGRAEQRELDALAKLDEARADLREVVALIDAIVLDPSEHPKVGTLDEWLFNYRKRTKNYAL